MHYNILFIMSDQQRYDMLSCNGSTYATTPNLDRLAASGCRFTNAYTTCPLCTPARAALFTGMWPSSAGYSANQDNAYRHVEFLGDIFSRAGYTAGYSGKWHLCGQHGYYGDGKPDGGFLPEYWYDGQNFIDEVGEENFRKWQKGEGLEDDDCWGTRVADRTIDFLETHKDSPFFFVASFDEPHGPSSAPEKYYDKVRGTNRERLPSLDDNLENKPLMHQRLADEYFGESARVPAGEKPNNSPRYYGCNLYLDDQIGRILDAVDTHCAENTVVVYTVDHGDHQGAHHLNAKGITMYDDTTRVSLLIRIPGMTGEGAVKSSLVSHIDLAPTLCELAGIDTHPQFAGRSIAPLLTGDAPDEERMVFLEYNRFGIGHTNHGGFFPVRCVRSDKYKLVLNLYDKDELYDMENDEYEMVNLIDSESHAGERNMLHDIILKWMNKRKDPLRGEGWHSRSWRPDYHINLKQ